ncbi:MAG: AAA family ATPase [Lachnospiraceae bacterium]
MENNKKELRNLAERIYDLDTKVYESLGSSLGRVFTQSREKSIRELEEELRFRNQGHIIRSDLALISNMARTIRDKEVRRNLMIEYDHILKEVTELPTSFAEGDVLNQKRVELNTVAMKDRFSENDHTIICIGRTFGSGGSEIGFTLADKLKINYYDAEIFSEVLRRLDAEKDNVADRGGFPYILDRENKDRYVGTKPAFGDVPKVTLSQKLHDFGRYHGLPKKDAVFFNQSQLLCDMAKQEDFVIMGRCADVILANNNIPHISIFITAPFEQRLQRVMQVNESWDKKIARAMLKKLDRKHKSYFKFYTGLEWGEAINYDMCINSASYGINGSVDMIMRMMNE